METITQKIQSIANGTFNQQVSVPKTKTHNTPIQLVSIEELIAIIKEKNQYEMAYILYTTKDSRASAKTPFYKTTYNGILLGTDYKRKVENASTIENHEAKPKESTAYNLDSESNKIGYSKRDGAPMLVYNFPKDTQTTVTTLFADAECTKELTLDEAFELMTPSGQNRTLGYAKETTSTQEIAQIAEEKEFRWQCLKLENLNAIKMRGTIYQIRK